MRYGVTQPSSCLGLIPSKPVRDSDVGQVIRFVTNLHLSLLRLLLGANVRYSTKLLSRSLTIRSGIPLTYGR